MAQYLYAIDTGITTTSLNGISYPGGISVGQTTYDLIVQEKFSHGIIPIENGFAGTWLNTSNNVGIYTTKPVGIGTSVGLTSQLTVVGSGTSTTQLFVSGVSTFSSIYQRSTGKIIGPGNALNTPSNNSISIDLSQSMVSIGTVGREPIWNFTNVSLTNSKMATVTIVGIASGSSVAMGRTYTINGGSNNGITWAATSVPNFDTTNWSILTFRFITDDVGVLSVFANKS
jgi:hypothetical protein